MKNLAFYENCQIVSNIKVIYLLSQIFNLFSVRSFRRFNQKISLKIDFAKFVSNLQKRENFFHSSLTRYVK